MSSAYFVMEEDRETGGHCSEQETLVGLPRVQLWLLGRGEETEERPVPPRLPSQCLATEQQSPNCWWYHKANGLIHTSITQFSGTFRDVALLLWNKGRMWQ